MPDLKCTACGIRLRAPGGDEIGELCPLCQAPLEPVGQRSEVVGFRLLERGGSAAEDDLSKPLTRPISDLTERRDARIEQSQLDAERWLDDGGSFDTQAVTVALDRLGRRTDL